MKFKISQTKINFEIRETMGKNDAPHCVLAMHALAIDQMMNISLFAPLYVMYNVSLNIHT